MRVFFFFFFEASFLPAVSFRNDGSIGWKGDQNDFCLLSPGWILQILCMCLLQLWPLGSQLNLFLCLDSLIQHKLHILVPIWIRLWLGGHGRHRPPREESLPPLQPSQCTLFPKDTGKVLPLTWALLVWLCRSQNTFASFALDGSVLSKENPLKSRGVKLREKKMPPHSLLEADFSL